ncbi:serine hydrolase domain-containing protein [Streptomyces litchfieldiae]|uniref:Serine hydrolase domain-containing protein n=1 Tax=Streptomyces litchfieldiae TaxID=3075543 RepID=A0ABU2MPW2_9ACTN|nr:serine hydrolase domain-containing protein [Streptomyces sp. DSM 44938]MDT0343655.1 serine hydrolase domain-containing protein [Streptomyces sp. DSM 44938]
MTAGNGGTPGDAAPPPLDRRAVSQALEGVIDDSALGGLIRVTTPDGVWGARAGHADADRTQPVDPRGFFRIGSITKTITATVVLQLVAERRIGLDAPLQQHVAGLLPAHYPPITVRQLLQHTSGVPNYLPRVTVDADRLIRDRYRRHTPEELLTAALARPPAFEPGTRLGYSNTNYVLLGLLVRAVTGRRWDEEVTRRITGPLGMTGTFHPGGNPALPTPHAHGYTRTTDGRLIDITQINASVWDAAGSMVATAADLDTYLAALLSGRLVPAPLLDEMLTPHPQRLPEVPWFGFGLGVQHLAAPGWDGPAGIHGGGGSLRGYTSMAFATRDGGRRVVLCLNVTTADEMRPVEKALAVARAVFGRNRPRP